MNILEKICAEKAVYVAGAKARTPLSALEQKIDDLPATRSFKKKIIDTHQSGPPAVIAEIKKASPSHGLIRPDFDPAAIAKDYGSNGAACLSVLTDEPFFSGRNADLTAARHAAALPVLRKDFMLDPWQIYESRALQADCILLIMAALTDAAAQELLALSRRLGMDALIEVHDRAELMRALDLGADMIGINNRNLKTLEVDINTSYQLRELIPDHAVTIAESGLRQPDDLRRLQEAGFTGFLVGESLMRQNSPGEALSKLRQIP